MPDNGWVPAVTKVLEFRALAERDPAWRLIRADQGPLIAGLLGEHLADETRRLDAEELYERLDEDLEELRAQGLELPLSAKGYCAQWRAAGYLQRRPDPTSRGETLELSPGAIVGIRFIQGLSAPRSSVTESRLASLAAQVKQLAIDTDPDVSRRVSRLEAEKERIETQIEALRSGEDWTLDPERALERARELLDQATEVPDDFSAVRAEFERLNSTLRLQIIESDSSQGQVVDEVFRGIDHIGDSEAGRSFAAFSQLVLDPAMGAAFSADIHRILERQFAHDLTPDERRNLRTLLTTLKARSAEIHDVITMFARALRRYVQSQDYQRDRVLRELLRGAQHAGVTASGHTRPWAHTDLSIDLSAVSINSVGAIRLYDPAEFTVAEEIITHEPVAASLDDLRAMARETEIDFAELIRNTNDVLSRTQSCTVAEVLAIHPATQGVASVVGLLSLAAEQGMVEEDPEEVVWHGIDTVERRALVPIHRFVGAIR